MSPVPVHSTLRQAEGKGQRVVINCCMVAFSLQALARHFLSSAWSEVPKLCLWQCFYILLCCPESKWEGVKAARMKPGQDACAFGMSATAQGHSDSSLCRGTTFPAIFSGKDHGEGCSQQLKGQKSRARNPRQLGSVMYA